MIQKLVSTLKENNIRFDLKNIIIHGRYLRIVKSIMSFQIKTENGCK